MMRIDKDSVRELARAQVRIGMASAMALALTTLAVAAHAATLPPPPVSPAPVTDYEYDAKGNPTKLIKAKGVSGFGFATSNSYDPLDRVKSNTDARSGVTTLGYDGQDQLKQVKDPRNLTTSYQRNGLGDLTQLSSPDTGTANNTYDAVGNLLTRTDSRGVLGTYTYDALNRMTSAVYSKAGQASQTYGWTYDQTGGEFTFGIGKLTTATSPDATTTYAYDALGRLASSTQTVATRVRTTRYGYDGAGHVTSITYPSGRVVTIAYANGQPSSISVAASSSAAAQPVISQIKWEPFGGVSGWLMHQASGTKAQERVYDQYGRLVRYPLGNVVRDLTYDAADRIVSYTHLDATTGQTTAAAQALNQSFGYDEMGRLTSISTPLSTWTIGYDANGNRTGVTLNGTARAYTTEAASNRLSGISNPTRSFGYDAAGNTLSDTGIAYTTSYRLDNRLGTLTKGGLATSYWYDAGGQRVHKENSAGMRDFVYDQDGQLLGEYSATSAVQEFVWLGGVPVAVLTGGAPDVMHVYSDHLGVPRLLTDKNDAIRWRWISEPFGSIAPETTPTAGLSAVTFNLRFPGQFFDAESGLSYNYFRDYDGTTGRYVQSDPIGLQGGMNTYAYAGANPLSNIDPSGLDWKCTNYGVAVQCVNSTPIVDPEIPRASSPAPSFTNPFAGLFKNRKPRWVTGKQEKYWDQANCSEGDPCEQIKSYIRQEILQARGKRDNMLYDKTLYRNAYTTPNPTVTGMNGTWVGHRKDLFGKIDKINEMIAMGLAMGCDMSQEIIMTNGLFVPNHPLSP